MIYSTRGTRSGFAHVDHKQQWNCMPPPSLPMDGGETGGFVANVETSIGQVVLLQKEKYKKKMGSLFEEQWC